MKVGDRVQIIKYGHIFWSSHELGEPFKKLGENGSGWDYDMAPDLVGLTGVIIEKSDGDYGVHLDPPYDERKRYWYNKEQLLPEQDAVTIEQPIRYDPLATTESLLGPNPRSVHSIPIWPNLEYREHILQHSLEIRIRSLVRIERLGYYFNVTWNCRYPGQERLMEKRLEALNVFNRNCVEVYNNQELNDPEMIKKMEEAKSIFKI